MNILVTGGAGYIGSHTTIELLNAGYDAVIVDNLSNSKIEAVRRIEKITGKQVKIYKEDICDRVALGRVFKENKIDAVINFAGLKAVGESVEKPVEYYYNNITGMLVLLDVMRANGCKNIVFSSSAMKQNPQISSYFKPLSRIDGHLFRKTKQTKEKHTISKIEIQTFLFKA